MKKVILVAILLAIMVVAGAMTVTERSLVNWREVHAVALESDDWGLPGFVPAADSWRGLDPEALGAGRFPPIYWGSTLEDSAVVARLDALLYKHRDRDGIPAVFQPNYVLGSLAWDAGAGRWFHYDLPQLPPEYQRPGLWAAVASARWRGVWHPELHAALHYDPEIRRQRGRESDLSREITRRGISLFPGSEHAWELAPQRPLTVLTAELDHSLSVFERVFGRPVDSVIAPDYTWTDPMEDVWQSRGLRVIQAKREQRNPQWLAGIPGRGQKYWERQWARLLRPQRFYLERNCRLEPVQSADPAAVVARCLADVRKAWRRGEPAIVETHRVNFAHTDTAVVAAGLAALGDLLDGICNVVDQPTFLCDREIGQMMAQGVSWRRAGPNLVLRNPSHGTRLVVLTGADLKRMGDRGHRLVCLRLRPGQVAVLPLQQIVEPSASRS